MSVNVSTTLADLAACRKRSMYGYRATAAFRTRSFFSAELRGSVKICHETRGLMGSERRTSSGLGKGQRPVGVCKTGATRGSPQRRKEEEPLHQSLNKAALGLHGSSTIEGTHGLEERRGGGGSGTQNFVDQHGPNPFFIVQIAIFSHYKICVHGATMGQVCFTAISSNRAYHHREGGTPPRPMVVSSTQTSPPSSNPVVHRCQSDIDHRHLTITCRWPTVNYTRDPSTAVHTTPAVPSEAQTDGDTENTRKFSDGGNKHPRSNAAERDGCTGLLFMGSLGGCKGGWGSSHPSGRRRRRKFLV